MIVKKTRYTKEDAGRLSDEIYERDIHSAFYPESLIFLLSGLSTREKWRERPDF